jgi:hypothetical protein
MEGVPASSAGPLSLAYITFDTIQSLRRDYVSRHKAARVRVICEDRRYLLNLESLELAEDAYIVAMLTALAQDQRRQQQYMSQVTDTTADSALVKTGPQPVEGTKAMLPTTTQSFKVRFRSYVMIRDYCLFVFAGSSCRPSGRTGAVHLRLHFYHFHGVPRQVRQTMALHTE